MRFFEVVAVPRKVVSTKRFDRDLRIFVKADPNVGRNLAAFLRFRETALPTESFGKKDAVFTGNSLLSTFRHVHLIHGKVIVSYQITASEIRLCTITDHKATETSSAFARFLSSLGSSDYHAFAQAQDSPQEAALTAEQRQAAIDALYDFAGHPDDREMLSQTAAGMYVPEMWEMLRALTGLDGDEQIENRRLVRAFDGIEGFRAKVAEVLAQTG